MSARKIEVLFFEGCPHADLALARAHEAVHSLGIEEAEVVSVKIESPEEAVGRRFLGSPSVRVDGQDVDASGSDDTTYALRCRLYSNDGRMEGAPPVAWMIAALRGQPMTISTVTSVAAGSPCCAAMSSACIAPAGEAAPADRGRPDLDVAVLADVLSAAFPAGTERVLVALIRLLAEGAPVSPRRLAVSLGWTVEDVVAAVAPIQSLEYEGDEIVGAGLSIRAAPHVFEVEGRTLYTWCALDALFLPALLGKTCRVSSRCTGTDQLVRLTVSPEEVLDRDPEGLVMSVVMGDCSADLRRSFCDRVRFFASAPAAVSVGADCGGLVLSIEDAFRLGQEVTRRLAWRV